MATTSAPDPFLTTGRLEREAARARTEELFLAHGRLVAGLCRGLLRNRADAEDAAQSTFLSAYRALLRGGEPRAPAAWLAAIARNECIARVRARMREPLPVDELDETAVDADPLTQALRRADVAAFWRAFSELAPQQRQALLLREFGGLSYDELGVALGVTLPAVESLLFRARSSMRERLQVVRTLVGGAGWIAAAQNVLARFGAAKLGSLPATAKVVTAAIGVAAAAGGAVVAEHQAPRPPVRRPAHSAPVVAPARPVSFQPARPAHTTAPTSAAPIRAAQIRHGGGSEVRRHDGGGDGEHGATQVARLQHDGHGGGDSGPLSTTSGSDGHDGEAASSLPTATAPATATVEVEQSDSHGGPSPQEGGDEPPNSSAD